MAAPRRIFHPEDIEPSESRLYFFDANVWLQLLNRFTIAPDMRPYVNLWDRLTEYYAPIGKPFAVVNPILLSEVFNRHLRNGFRKFDEDRPAAEMQALEASRRRLPGDKLDYKRHYRYTADFRDRAEAIRYEFAAYASFYKFVENVQEEALVAATFAGSAAAADFNDRYYLAFAEAHKLTIVTHDGDFNIGHAPVDLVTANPRIIATS